LIYNFAIYSLVHFSSKIGTKSWSKWPEPNWTRHRNAPPCSRAPERARARRVVRTPRRARDHRFVRRAPRDIGGPQAPPRVAPTLAVRPSHHLSDGPSALPSRAHAEAHRRTTALTSGYPSRRRLGATRPLTAYK
jgi:hypothetical protein